jgi:hypothetical protein
MSESIRFFVEKDFEFNVGKDKTEIKVPRLLFVQGKKVLEAIADILASDAGAMLRFLGQAKDANESLQMKSFGSYAKAAEIVVKKLVIDQNYTILIELLELLGDGKFTAGIRDTMQYGEIADILTHLIEGNFSSLKNLSASLQVMSTSVQPGKSS